MNSAHKHSSRFQVANKDMCAALNTYTHTTDAAMMHKGLLCLAFELD